MAEQEVNPTLFEAVEAVAQSAVAGVNVALPARVEGFNASEGTVSVTPLIGARTNQGAEVALPTLSGVPVSFPTGGGYTFRFPLGVGDLGVLLVCDRSLDEWKAGAGQRVQPTARRRHNLADAVFLPGVQPRGSSLTLPATADAEGLYLGQIGINALEEQRRVEVTSEGKLLLGDGIDDVISLVYDALDTLRTATYGGNPMDPVSAAALSALLLRLDDLKP